MENQRRLTEYKMRGFKRKWLPRLTVQNCIVTFLASTFLACGLYHVHSCSGITEGGVLGAVLLLQHWFGISPAITNLVLNACCYLLGFRLLGKNFLAYSGIGTVTFSVAYKICECFPPLGAPLAAYPAVAMCVGAVFVGLGAGFCVWAGGAPSGDDALAMSLSHLTHLKIQWIYLASDLVVLALSLTYIPVRRIIWSLGTVILSGQMIGWVQKIPHPQKTTKQKSACTPACTGEAEIPDAKTEKSIANSKENS